MASVSGRPTRTAPSRTISFPSGRFNSFGSSASAISMCFTGLPTAPRLYHPVAALISQLALRRLSTDDGLSAEVVADFVVTLLLDGLRPRPQDENRS